MNRILYYILLILIVGLASGFMFKASFSFPENTETHANITQEKKWYSVSLGKDADASISYQDIDKQSIKNLPDDSIVFGEFGRLSSIMYLYKSGSTFPAVTRSGSNQVILHQKMGIVSLYDLFTLYTIEDDIGEFRIDQVTNGSFYIGKEEDGKIAIYTIDGVIRLHFLDGGKEMTNMLLFPGSYIRFDPSRNHELNGTDLFRTILSLDVQENEIFEFVNPRVNSGDDSDTFFNYRLPVETKYLFRALSRKFHAQIEQVDLMKQYGSDFTYTSSDASGWLYNPAKKNYFMLLELRQLLSRVVKADKGSEDLEKRISELYMSAKDLNLGSNTDSSMSARETIEKFLLDGRFALYGNVGDIGKGYQQAYENIAKLIDVHPTKGKSKLLQNLSDIYSANLFLQTKKTTTFRIDTFEPTATSLRTTLGDSSIDNKDYFDIAIYSYNILEKIQENGLFSFDYLENKSTYDYLITFFYAGSRYMESIDDSAKKNDIIRGFSSRFYERILTMIVDSLYSSLMYEDEGLLYLKKELVEGTKIKIEPTTMDYISELYGVVDLVHENIKTGFEGATEDMGTYASIQKSTLRLSALSKILDPDNHEDEYAKYIEAPFVAEMTGSSVPLPQVRDTLESLVTKDPHQDDILSQSGEIDPKISSVAALFPEADIASLSLDDAVVRMDRVLSSIVTSNGSSVPAYWTMVFSENNTLSQIQLEYNGRPIKLHLPAQEITFEEFEIMRTKSLAPYIDILDKNTDILGEIRLFLQHNRLDIGDTIFNL